MRSGTLCRVGRGAVALCLSWLLTGCGGVTTKIPSPLALREPASRINEAVGLYVPEESRKYVFSGNINVMPYRVEFGNALEPNAKHALSKLFRDVVLLDRFPPTPQTAHGIARALSVGIESAQVEPGFWTFSPTSATLRLKVGFAVGERLEKDPILVEGHGRGSPGILGFAVVLFMNQMAYEMALQRASERAMVNALENLMDAIAKHQQKATR